MNLPIPDISTKWKPTATDLLSNDPGFHLLGADNLYINCLLDFT
jgi:hypothetical protein